MLLPGWSLTHVPKPKLSQFSYTAQAQLSRDGAVQRELGHPTSIIKEDNAPET